MSLKPEKHPSRDFFIADIFDNTTFKNDMASMEHPIFVLSKNKDMRNLEYKNGNTSIIIKPTTDGLPTIFDKDVLLYCSSLLMSEINAGRTPTKTLRVSSHDLLVATNRKTSGEGYRLLKKALDRLQGVSIKTNIKTNKQEITKAFSLIDSYSIIESSRVKDRMVKLEITLSDWLYNSIIGEEVLTINRDYFRLGKPTERRIYEIARKFCGYQKSFEISLSKLIEKTGSTSTPRKFKYFIKEISKNDHLPDYSININDNNKVTFTRKTTTEKQPELPLDNIPHISPDTIRKAQNIISNSTTALELPPLQEEFTMSLINGFKPKKINGAFINFIKKKIQTSS